MDYVPEKNMHDPCIIDNYGRFTNPASKIDYFFELRSKSKY